MHEKGQHNRNEAVQYPDDRHFCFLEEDPKWPSRDNTGPFLPSVSAPLPAQSSAFGSLSSAMSPPWPFSHWRQLRIEVKPPSKGASAAANGQSLLEVWGGVWRDVRRSFGNFLHLQRSDPKKTKVLQVCKVGECNGYSHGGSSCLTPSPDLSC